MELVEILYRIMYKNMPSVLLGGSLGGLTGRTPLGQPDPETRTGRTTPKILTRKPGSDGQQPPRAGSTLSKTKSNNYVNNIINMIFISKCTQKAFSKFTKIRSILGIIILNLIAQHL